MIVDSGTASCLWSLVAPWPKHISLSVSFGADTSLPTIKGVRSSMLLVMQITCYCHMPPPSTNRFFLFGASYYYFTTFTTTTFTLFLFFFFTTTHFCITDLWTCPLLSFYSANKVVCSITRIFYWPRMIKNKGWGGGAKRRVWSVVMERVKRGVIVWLEGG
jgi:hypothetical protein